MKLSGINDSDYGFLVVSFLVVSIFILLVSFLVVSTTVVLDVSVTLVVSVVLVELVPLHAANDKAIKATKLNLMMFFMVFDELINNCLKIG
jgi:hypothetical protein